MIFVQIENKKNFTSNFDVDTSFFSNMNKNHANKAKKRRKKFKKLVIRKCVKIKINIQSENQIWNESQAIFDTKTKINLINHVYAKKFNLRRFEVLDCDAITIDNHRLKIYDVYFVQFEISNVKSTNRFFEESFLVVNLNWNLTLNMFWIQLSKIKINWDDDSIKSWRIKKKHFIFITMRIEKIEFEQLTKNVIDDKIETYFMFVRIYIDKQFDMQKMHVQRRV